jgi:deazaflavin-dependent oxidoreductase (nitroreductase family)
MDADRKASIVRRAQKLTFNRVFVWLAKHRITHRYAVIETTGRKSGQPRQVPVANGLVGDQFWVVAEQGRRADWVRNAAANPVVRVCIRGQWRTGTANILDDDDPAARFGNGVPKWNARFVRALGTDLLTVRIDLNS